MSTKAPRFLVVFTGGTISSRKQNGIFALSEPPYHLLTLSQTSGYTYKIIEPDSILSENITGEFYNKLFFAIARETDEELYDGIIIAHGTDTLAYTAQLCHLVLSSLGIPVILIGSKIPPEEQGSDAPINFTNACILAQEVTDGVYVVSRTEENIDEVHYAARMMQPIQGSDDFVSWKNQLAGTMEDGHFTIASLLTVRELSDADATFLHTFTSYEKAPPQSSVLLISGYPGMNFDRIYIGREDYRYILLTLFHAGTANALPKEDPCSVLHLLALCEENHKELYIAPIDRAKTPYSSTQAILQAGAIPLYDMPIEAAWAKLLLQTWSHGD